MRAPGALHHARFLASSLYIMKPAFLADALPKSLVTPVMQDGIDRMAQNIALFHGPWFLQARLSVCAPWLDLQLWQHMTLCEVSSYNQGYYSSSTCRWCHHGILCAAPSVYVISFYLCSYCKEGESISFLATMVLISTVGFTRVLWQRSHGGRRKQPWLQPFTSSPNQSHFYQRCGVSPLTHCKLLVLPWPHLSDLTLGWHSLYWALMTAGWTCHQQNGFMICATWRWVPSLTTLWLWMTQLRGALRTSRTLLMLPVMVITMEIMFLFLHHTVSNSYHFWRMGWRNKYKSWKFLCYEETVLWNGHVSCQGDPLCYFKFY